MPKGKKYLVFTNTKQFECSCGYRSRKYREERACLLAKRLHEKNCDDVGETEQTTVTLNLNTCEVTEGAYKK